MRGRRGIRRRRGLGGRREVIPRIQQSMMRCNRSSPLRVAVVIRGVVRSMMRCNRSSPLRVAVVIRGVLHSMMHHICCSP